MSYKIYVLSCGVQGLNLLQSVEKVGQVVEKSNILENGYYITQIISGIFVIFGTFVAVRQYLLACKDSKKSRERDIALHEKEVAELEKDRIQRAIDLAGFFKDNIITKVHILFEAYRATGVSDILKKINFQNITHFDRQELEEVINSEDRKTIEQIIENPKLIQVLAQSSDVTGLWSECKNVIEIQKEDGIIEKVVHVKARAITYRFEIMLQDILNDLEFFAMHFHHKTADESVVYQSLHVAFIEVVQLLYYDISSNNITSEKKLYTNVIALYNDWYSRAMAQKESETAATREVVLHGSVVRNIDK